VDGVALVVGRRLAADAMRELIVNVEQLLKARGWDDASRELARSDAHAPQAECAFCRGLIVTFVAFDALEIAGVDQRSRPWAARRDELERLLAGAHGALRLTPVLDSDQTVHDALIADGWEGTVAKRQAGRYVCGRRSGAWIETKSPAARDRDRRRVLATRHAISMSSDTITSSRRGRPAGKVYGPLRGGAPSGRSISMSIAGEQPASAPGMTPMPPPPGGAQFMELFAASLATHLIDAALKYQLPRRLLDGPRSSMELADMTGLHEPSLYRVLRALTVFGVFTEQPGRRFELGPLGPTAAQFDDSMDWLDAALKTLPSALQTGTTGMQLAHGTSFFEYVSEHPAAGQTFDVAMKLMHDGELEAVAETYDFASAQTVLDVGGGNGTGLATILQRHPHLRGVLFELPAVIERAGPALAEALGERCGLVAGDFFTSLPVRGDVFLLSRVIHDWDDQHAATILRNCRRAMNADDKLVLAEMLIPPEDEPHPAKIVDIAMLLLTGGMERTEQQYAELFEAAGLKLTRVIPTPSAVSAIEAIPSDRR
jgi:hypothetical protein